MVSALWKACSEGDLTSVQEILREASTVDIEIKGATPLIEAVKNGHSEVVRVLLEKGADPANGSSQGCPEDYTSEPSILELLRFAQNRSSPDEIAPHEPVQTPDANDESNKRYYGATSPVAYTYYPNINTAPLSLPEGSMYYPPPPPPQGGGDNNVSGGIGNLPPPEVARLIPCRYFPACRYGSSCLFAHPQAPYFQGSMPPPAQYVPPYEQMAAQPYAPNYYAVPPPSFQSPNVTHHMAPLSPPPASHVAHGQSPSDVMSPAQPPFAHNGIPSPYGPMSPTAYTHSGQVSVPMSIPPLPPLQHQTSLPPPNPQSPSNMYPSPPPTGPPYIVQDPTNQYSPLQSTNATTPYHNVNSDIKPPSSQSDTYGLGPTHPNHRDGAPHNRRGTTRRGSFGGSRKPPCLFFPAGRCKNGDECRFPHVTPDASGSHHAPYYGGRGAPRPRQANGNGFSTIEEKMANMSIREEPPRQLGGVEASSRSSSDPGRPRFPVKNNHVANGVRNDKKPPAIKQRVPNADEFPVLAGSTTPPSRSPGFNGALSNGNGHGAPTAAQVLQAPPPARKDSVKESSTRGTTPDPIKVTTHSQDMKPIINGSTPDAIDLSMNKPAPSFAAVATIASEIPKEITLSA